MCCWLQLKWQFRFFCFLIWRGRNWLVKKGLVAQCDSERTLKYPFDSHASPNVSVLYLHINKTDLNFQVLAEAFFILTHFSQESSFGVLLFPYSPCELCRVFFPQLLFFVWLCFGFDFSVAQWNTSLRRGEQTNHIAREIAGWLLSLPPGSACHAMSLSLGYSPASTSSSGVEPTCLLLAGVFLV